MSSLPYPQSCHQFSLDEILLATQNFDESLVVGKGGFGKVYKATITVENGATFTVAIKRLDRDSSQGAPEFCTEIEMLTKLRHCNLVSLIGYCSDESEMILVYEFMQHGTLDGHLHKYGTSLSWVHRLNISVGAARGLHYLHTGTGTQHGVIHRDVKTSNILLDEDYAAKISDFGLSKISPTNASRSTYVNTLIKGTFGYLDPEYFLTGRLTRKSDVFAFGVVLFELLCGRAALDNSLDEEECSLAKWAHESIEEGKVYDIIDSNIKSQISPKCLKVFVQTADRCLVCESKKRPTITEILLSLELSLTLQNKFDNRVKPAVGIMSIARMIKWPFITTEVTSAQSDRKLSTDNEDTIERSSSSKENRLTHVADHTDEHIKVSSAAKIQILASDLKKFSFDDLKKATRSFRYDRRLGGGEFGEVFEGLIDNKTSSLSVDDGMLRIAIKMFNHSTIQLHLKEELVDMTFLSGFNHPNLVKVLGYCFKDKRLFLIYEFMENGSLESHLLFTKDTIPLPWKTRVQIAKGVAEALFFLQKTQTAVQNRPIELRHILLDKNFNAKISNFESARLVYGPSYTKVNADPLYYLSPLLKPVFEGIMPRFGKVLFQILTGQHDTTKLQRNMRNPKGDDMKECLRRALDPRLPNVNDNTIDEAMKLAQVALCCLDDYSYSSYTLDKALDVLQKL